MTISYFTNVHDFDKTKLTFSLDADRRNYFAHTPSNIFINLNFSLCSITVPIVSICLPQNNSEISMGSTGIVAAWSDNGKLYARSIL